jgi:hypothetical protein
MKLHVRMKVLDVDDQGEDVRSHPPPPVGHCGSMIEEVLVVIERRPRVIVVGIVIHDVIIIIDVAFVVNVR